MPPSGPAWPRLPGTPWEGWVLCDTWHLQWAGSRGTPSTPSLESTAWRGISPGRRGFHAVCSCGPPGVVALGDMGWGADCWPGPAHTLSPQCPQSALTPKCPLLGGEAGCGWPWGQGAQAGAPLGDRLCLWAPSCPVTLSFGHAGLGASGAVPRRTWGGGKEIPGAPVPWVGPGDRWVQTTWRPLAPHLRGYRVLAFSTLRAKPLPSPGLTPP